MNSDTTLRFESIAPADIEAFQTQREKILTAVYDRFSCDPVIKDSLNDAKQMRLARESANIFVGNFYSCVKYNVPDALTEYLVWLRSFLQSREIDSKFLPRMIHAVQMSTRAFLPEPEQDSICSTLHFIKKQELEAR